jgi:hypothetical protein
MRMPLPNQLGLRSTSSGIHDDSCSGPADYSARDCRRLGPVDFGSRCKASHGPVGVSRSHGIRPRTYRWGTTSGLRSARLRIRLDLALVGGSADSWRC